MSRVSRSVARIRANLQRVGFLFATNLRHGLAQRLPARPGNIHDLFVSSLTCGRRFAIRAPASGKYVRSIYQDNSVSCKNLGRIVLFILQKGRIELSDKLDDFLYGAIAIGNFLNLKMPEEVDKIYRLVEKKIIPVGRVGGPRGMFIGSKRRIAAQLDKIASGETA
jgi:hypothetical protein